MSCRRLDCLGRSRSLVHDPPGNRSFVFDWIPELAAAPPPQRLERTARLLPLSRPHLNSRELHLQAHHYSLGSFTERNERNRIGFKFGDCSAARFLGLKCNDHLGLSF